MPDGLRYHLIGIGGVGMSAIAQILHDRGETVSGSDRQESDITRRLRRLGISIAIGHSESNVTGADVVVYSAAISKDNPEMVEARRQGIPLLERPAMLGRIMEPYKHRIAVSGTHGKTTTTSMIDAILDRAGLHATTLIGGDVRSIGGNARLGQGSIILTEACEAFESFLHLYPSIAVVTNIDADHLEYYGTIEHIEDSFRQFINQVDTDGCVVACWDDERTRRAVEGCGRRAVSFGLQGKPDLLADQVDVSTPEAGYALVRDGRALGHIRLGVPGEQNVVDSLAAAAVAFELDIGFEEIKQGLAEFKGVSRRFDVLFDYGGMMVVDDYAHHPAEITATLKAARAAYDKRVIAVFQPHLYSRTRFFMGEFARALALADEVVVTSIYASREQPMENLTAESIVEEMKREGFSNVRYVSEKDSLVQEFAERVNEGDMVLTLGAGDIRSVAEHLAARLTEKAHQV